MMKLRYEGVVYGEPVYRRVSSWPVRAARCVVLALRIWRKPWQPAPPLDDTYSPFADIDLATAFVVARGLL
jgi:hypothetical protein